MNHRPPQLRSLDHAPHLRPVDRPLAACDRPALPIQDLPSPNHDARPDGVPIDMLVLHYTGMKTPREAVDRLRDPAAKVSSHYIVDEDGSVARLVPEDRRAWHAGVSHWRGHAELNGRSIGIEIVNPGHEWGYRDFPVLQVAAVCDLCLLLMARHPIPARNVIGHSDVAPDRKQDPGERFDWQELAENGVGLWPHDVPDLGRTGGVRDPVSLRPVRSALNEIGYRIAPEGGLDPALSTVLRAFQRHWRPEAISGQADDGTLVRLQGVLRLVRDG
ncbi:N-acetylmuramoyl-L-alanine amidase [Rhodopila sp.]|uniref:N-acetylmuramoyl-L-alanine amidase n=1 Tax=Rhodopila sp. TaxID=2480087 RepID=UPI003D121A55